MLLLVIVTACKPKIDKLPFETMSQADGFDTGRSYGGEEPALLVIATRDEIEKPDLDIQFSSELTDQLLNIDYNHFFAVMVFHGRIGSTKVSITVEQVTRQGKEVTINANIVRPAPGTRSNPAFTSPYHLIAISKEGKWSQDVKFVVVVDGKPVAETTHFIP
jgi:hypothetical protein